MKTFFFATLLVLLLCETVFSQDFATVTQAIDNKDQIKGKEFRYSAYVRLEKGSTGNGALWFRVDKSDGNFGFFDNMGDRPITSDTWKKYEITGTIDIDVNKIFFGCLLLGEGKLWVDKIVMEYKNEKGEWTNIDVRNSGFEEVAGNSPKGWAAYSEDYVFTCDSLNAYEGKISVRIETIPEVKTQSEFVRNGAIIKLPAPKTDGNISVEKALSHRRSIRNYSNDSLTLAEVSQMLWAAWGISDSTTYKGFYLRTTPSAGALYPFEVYLVAGKVIGLEAGVYKYDAIKNSLTQIIKGDIRVDLFKASYSQTFVKKAPISIFWSAVFERTTSKYHERGRERYVCMDVGHSGENVYLQAEGLGLGTCAIGAFSDNAISKLLGLPKEEEPLYIMPVGRLTKEELEKRK